MCLSSNMKHLITSSSEGIIYIWKLPDSLQKALNRAKSEMQIIKETEEAKQKVKD